jgi:S-adenosylmethionine hydrolase
MRPIALLTDFGAADWYVAAMKGVLLSQAPAAPLVDVTHEIPPGDVARGETARRELGRRLEGPVRLGALQAAGADHAHAEGLARAAAAGALHTTLAHGDRFGNAITGLHELELEAWLGRHDPSRVRFVAHGARPTTIVGLARTYGAASQGEPIALVGSSGLLELAIPGGHAGLTLGLVPGDVVELLHEEP